MRGRLPGKSCQQLVVIIRPAQVEDHLRRPLRHNSRNGLSRVSANSWIFPVAGGRFSRRLMRRCVWRCSADRRARIAQAPGEGINCRPRADCAMPLARSIVAFGIVISSLFVSFCRFRLVFIFLYFIYLVHSSMSVLYYVCVVVLIWSVIACIVFASMCCSSLIFRVSLFRLSVLR